MNKGKFTEFYKKLNSAQKKAVDAIEGPVMVIAGPGTGKTQVLTLRIANILQKTDTKPDSILALTFTEAGVTAIRKRLLDLIGPTAHHVGIFTFHGFCNEVIRRFPAEFPRIIGSHYASNLDQIRILEEVIRTSKLKYLKPFGSPLYYLSDILSAIKELKRDAVTPKALEASLFTLRKKFSKMPDRFHKKGKYKGQLKGEFRMQEKKIGSTLELCRLYTLYEKALRKKGFYDYEDMIMEVLDILPRNTDLRLSLQEEYQYILADEHQDANLAQNNLLELLSDFHADPNLFVVGDDMQAIFRFQGASLENFLFFKKRFPNALLIELKENYRSTQTILNAAHSLSEHTSGDRLTRHALRSQKKGVASKIEIVECSEEREEALFVAREIEKQLRDIRKGEQIAVLYRDNKHAEFFEGALRTIGIPYSIRSESNIFEDIDIQKFILLLSLVNVPSSSTLLSQVLFIDFLDNDYTDIYKAMLFAKHERLELFEVISSKRFLKKASVENADGLLQFHRRLMEWAHSAKNQPLVPVVEMIKDESGFLTGFLAKNDAHQKLSLLKAFLDEVVHFAKTGKNGALLGDFISHLETLRMHSLPIASYHRDGESPVVLMTVHRSKGLEFDSVYITGVTHGRFGGRVRSSPFILSTGRIAKDTSLDDERRLFYVGLTRAKRRAVVTYFRSNASGKEVAPSLFISEINKDLIEIRKPEPLLLRQLNKIETSSAVAAPSIQGVFLQDIFFEQGLSVSALNNYLTCPWRYFFLNLVRIPKAEEPHQLYGSAIHYALKIFFNATRGGHTPSVDKAVHAFKSRLEHSYLSATDRMRYIDRGRKALLGYLKMHKKVADHRLINEMAISGVSLPVDILGIQREITIRGNLDKVEFLSNGHVCVIDYKTGAPKSRAEILGTTKNADGNIFRQLAFYKLLLDEWQGGRYVMHSGRIDFVEPDSRENYRQEVFEVTTADVSALKKVIGEAAREIATLSFWGTTCGEKNCEYCNLRRYWKK